MSGYWEIDDEECMRIGEDQYYEEQYYEEQYYHALDNFYEKIYSDYDTDFFVCDCCIEEFRKEWDGINIAHGTHEDDMVSLSEFDDFSFNDFLCPNCGEYLKYSDYIWPCSMSIIPNIHVKEMKQIAVVAKKTPFLLLKEKFAVEVYNLLMNISEKTNAMQIDETLYRCQKIKELDEFKKADYSKRVERMGPPPYEKASEGRFNHNGFSHLYVATSGTIAYKEAKDSKKQPNYMAQFEITKPLKILDLTDINGDLHYGELYKSIIYSSLIYNSPGSDGWNKPEYIFTRFIADCAVHLSFDVIKYKSRYTNKGGNFVIFNDKIDDKYPRNQAYNIKEIYAYSEERPEFIDFLEYLNKLKL